MTGRQVTSLHAEVLAKLGRVDEARSVEERIKVATEAPRPTAVDQQVQARRRDRLAVASGVGLGVFGVVGLPLAALGWRREPRPTPWGLLPLLVLGLGAGAIAELYTAGGGRAVPPLVALFVVLHLVAAGGMRQIGAERPALRVAFGLLAALATLGGAFLVLWQQGSLGDIWL